ncbi:RagB/SusD family nutrient uptake outer membrane protein [Pedobacter mucosus]|uniref:RagB/SusD family nutrient uptake outer membrane protein n=1 Tax=Pedobacter mucosus TaxID=2895286 RepID=UPI001EE42682|nr:RagB/SusD family nutrient uptake outer membrane protein [Pedobacter mucosus]UKT63597.1 RagB/SusD family nutrient uptake outer membrane protein [Pedobacter mucosus]
MKIINIKYLSFLMLITVSSVLYSCKKEYKDPNGAIAADVLSSSKGLTGVAVGLQRVYTVSRPGLLFNSITANGFVTNEVLLRNSGNIPELQLSTGAVDGTNSILFNLWANANKIIFDADNVITNATALADKNYASGLIAYSSVFKALAIGNMSQYWERVPASIGTNVSFISRVEGFNRAIAVIDNAIAVIGANAMSPTFLAQIPAGMDITNTLYALKARYALFAGNYPLALTAANSVDLTKRSSFNFDAITLNPIFEISTSTNNVFQPTDANLGLAGAFVPDAGDRRILFYTTTSTTAPTVRINGFGAAVATAVPIYLPGEITLIKAEVYARTPDLNNALVELNKVITKTAAADPFGVGAALPALTGAYTQQQLLDLIYKNRCIELYMSGLKLEDMRRFNRPATERKRNFFPYPFQERDNNPNTPADPNF